MKKSFKLYFSIWAIILALFNLIVFIVPGDGKYTVTFWIGYALITLTFLGQLICAHVALKSDNAKKLFLNLSLLQTGYIALFASFIAGGICMLIPVLPYWIGAIVCAIVLAINVLALAMASAASDAVEQTDKKIQTQTVFIRTLTVDAESLLACVSNSEIREPCKKVYEALRYSDPMSNDALSDTEAQIALFFSDFKEAVIENRLDDTKAIAAKLLALIGERNKKCKLLK